MMVRRWCVAWDAGMFGVAVDSRHLTPLDALLWKALGACGYPGYFVTTVKKARAMGAARAQQQRDRGDAMRGALDAIVRGAE